ncbi:MAG: hypothetical protein MR545_05670 [Veillonellaceae bacterium]|nr:hypothetical protein [Veillonellaceae bacterium]
MDWQNLDKKMNSLRRCMDVGDYAKARPLYEQLQAEYRSQSDWATEYEAIGGELAEIYAAMVVETNSQQEIPVAIAQLQESTGRAYHGFLVARLHWQAQRYLKALGVLEELCQLSWHQNKPIIPPENDFWQASPREKEVILNLLGQAYKHFGMVQQAAECYRLASETGIYFPVQAADYSNYVFTLHYIFMPQWEYVEAHKVYNALYSVLKPFIHDRRQLKRRQKKRGKLRIGYISPDFRRHVVLLFIWAMVTKYNRQDFEVYCFSNSPTEDEYSKYIQKQVDFWCNISQLPLRDKALVVYQQELDILVDLTGHSRDNCLPVLGYKPAPIQISGIGYFATTGLQTVDYFLSDKYLAAGCALIPAESNQVIDENLQATALASSESFTEKLLVLPHSHFCYVPIKEMPPVQQAPCMSKGYITFGSFNNLIKVNDVVLKTWGAILQQVPNSRLLLKYASLDDADIRELFRQKLLSLGLPEEQFQLRGFSADYLPEYYEMDIALDTFPYPGGGTTCDALYMGVPVVTLGDGSHGGNFGISLLKNIGLDFACSYSVEEYIQKALLLAQDRELLNVLHLGLRNMMENSPIMNEKQYMQELEQGYKRIWQEL